MKPCRSPYCECEPGHCESPGFYDARAEVFPHKRPPLISPNVIDEALSKANATLDREAGRIAKLIEADLLKGYAYGTISTTSLLPQFAEALGSKLSIPGKLHACYRSYKLEWQILL